jgi:hypothetical protein
MRGVEVGFRSTETIKFYFRKHFSADVRAESICPEGRVTEKTKDSLPWKGFIHQREGCDLFSPESEIRSRGQLLVRKQRIDREKRLKVKIAGLFQRCLIF